MNLRNKLHFTINDYTFRESDKFHLHPLISNELIQETITEQFEYIEECISNKMFNISVTHDFLHTIGVTHCVTCPPNTKGVYFAHRGNRPYLSRMVRGILPQESSLCTVIIRFNTLTEDFIIISAWIGGASKPELGNINYFEHCSNPLQEIMESAEFWMNHALIKED